MERYVKQISNEMRIQTQEIFNSNNDLYGKATCLMKTLQAFQQQIKQYAIESMDSTYVDSHDMQKFISEYNQNLENNWVKQLYLVMERVNNQFNGEFNTAVLDALMVIFNKEFSYFYKNIQYIVIKEKNLQMKFVAHDSCCNVCKFAKLNNFVTNDFITVDDCDSYFVKQADMMLVDNLVSGNIKIYNVPVKYKRSISSFYQLLKLRFGDFLKKSIKIKFVADFNFDDSKKDISDLIEYCYDKETNTYQIKFDEQTYKYYLVKSLLDMDMPEKVNDLYYRNNKNVIFKDRKFISYLAEQSAEDYFIESCIAYILSPDKLQEIDSEMYDILTMEFERR